MDPPEGIIPQKGAPSLSCSVQGWDQGDGGQGDGGQRGTGTGLPYLPCAKHDETGVLVQEL